MDWPIMLRLLYSLLLFSNLSALIHSMHVYICRCMGVHSILIHSDRTVITQIHLYTIECQKNPKNYVHVVRLQYVNRVFINSEPNCVLYTNMCMYMYCKYSNMNAELVITRMNLKRWNMYYLQVFIHALVYGHIQRYTKHMLIM